MIIILFFFSILFGMALVFEIRELYYLSRSQRPESDDEGCLYKITKSDKNGIVTLDCRNKFYRKKFIKIGKRCPSRCQGQTYIDCNNNFETMARTDRYFIAKKLLNVINTIMGMVLVALDIIDKIS